MSRNDQLLVKEHNGKFYVFDVMAESWGELNEQTDRLISHTNHLSLKEAKGEFDTRDEAHKFAHKVDSEDEWGGSEYGVVDEVLYKDGAPVVIVEASQEEQEGV